MGTVTIYSINGDSHHLFMTIEKGNPFGIDEWLKLLKNLDLSRRWRLSKLTLSKQLNGNLYQSLHLQVYEENSPDAQLGEWRCVVLSQMS